MSIRARYRAEAHLKRLPLDRRNPQFTTGIRCAVPPATYLWRGTLLGGHLLR
jgi:hypothetical protein